ncbi:MAG: MlaD family protein [Puniceicoccaceae bacterium]
MKSNRKALLAGSFVLIGMILLASAFLIFGGRSVLTPKARFVTFFNQSVAGLEIGSTVRFRGVPVGKVVSIQIRLAAENPSVGIPVHYEIDVRRLRKDLGVEEDIQSPEIYLRSLSNGLTATLEAESLVTGILFIALDFRPQHTPADIESLHLELFEIPPAPSQFSNIQEDLTRIISNFRQVDVARLAESSQNLIDSIQIKVDQLEVDRISAETIELFAVLRKQLEDLQLSALAADGREALGAFQTTLASLDASLSTLLPNLEASLSEFRSTGASFNQVAQSLEILLGKESPFLDETFSAIRELEATLKAFRQLIRYLEDNPNSLILGRHD